MRIDDIDDLAMARQVMRLLEQENTRLLTKLTELTDRLSKLLGSDGATQLAIEIVKLQEEKALLEKRLFGRSSEKESQAGDGKKKREPKPGHGPREQPELPIDERIHDFDGAVSCDLCGANVELWDGQFEEAEEITVIQRRFVITQHKRRKARCGCYATVVTAPGPPKLIPGGRYSIEFAVDVAVSKYLDHLPLHRQARIMEREGLVIDSHTLWDQIEALAKHLQPTYDALRGYVVGKPLVHADETPWYLLEKPVKKWYVWCVTAEDAAYFWIRGSRSAAVGKEVLDGYCGVVVVDGYKAYDTLARENKKLTLAYCWAHVRRKFVEAEMFYPVECKVVLDLIGELYALEKQLPNPILLKGDRRREALELRAQVRKDRSLVVVEKIYQWATTQNALPQSALRKAIDYMFGLWGGLQVFLTNPLVPLDNNAVERELRGPVVGRKNHYGSRSVRGTEVSALFYSLIETAKLAGVDPKAYLIYATKKSIDSPGASAFPHVLRPKPPASATPN